MKKISLLLIVILIFVFPILVEAKNINSIASTEKKYSYTLLSDDEEEEEDFDDEEEEFEDEEDEIDDDELDDDDYDIEDDDVVDNSETADIPILVISLLGIGALVIALKNVKTVQA